VPLALAQSMAALRQTGRRAFIPFLTAGYPDFETSRRLLGCTGRADFVEVGLPFSDPVADGPTIVQASEVALAHGMHPDRLFELLASAPPHPPVIVMTYINPVLAYGGEAFMRAAAAAGVAGVILTDVPPEDASELHAAAAAASIATVQLVSPTTLDARMARIAATTTGFLYCVALTGTTGARGAFGTQAETTIARLRRVTELPVVVGFGIATPEHVTAACRFADGAVVGSALLDFVRTHATSADLLPEFERRIDALAAAAHAPRR
jgi:tryptophan synthase alpha chain